VLRPIPAERHEWPALAGSFAYFFFLLAGYYVLRPVRDTMAVAIGSAGLPMLFTAMFVVMLALVPLFGWLSARLPRRQLLPGVYAFFVLNLVAFYAALHGGIATAAIAPVVFVWVSVYNLFVVSVFWSFMADLWSSAQAERLYGAIAAGGSLGAIAGPAITSLAAQKLGTANLLLVSAAFLVASIACIVGLGAWARANPRPATASDRDAEQPLGGSVLAGIRAVIASPYLIGICAWLLCYSLLSTTLYFQQIEIVGREIPDAASRTQLFASVDLAVNTLTLLFQVLLFPRLVAALGVGWMLALMPILSVAGFLALGAAPVLAVLVVFGVVRRAGEFAISKPVRETLFTVVPREEKYKAKNFIDTVIYRGGDTSAGWIFGGLRGLGLSLSAISFAMVPLALGWAAVSLYLGRRHAALRDGSVQKARARAD
jgi:AAA family ATP:ADP antiporter